MSEAAVLPLPVRRAPLSLWGLLRRAGLAVPLTLAGVFALWLVVTNPFPGPDELEHVSYAAILQETGRLVPRFESQVTLYRNDLTLWSDRVNYVGHPSPYYLYVAQFLDRALPLDDAIARVRLASLVLLLGGVVAGWAGGMRAFAGDRVAAWGFALGIAWCPEVLTVASQVNNDAMAILAGGMAYWAAVRNGAWGRAMMAGALAVALWAKPNAGLEVGLFAGFAWLLAPRRDWRGLAALVAGGVIGLLPTVPIVLRYGAVVPVAAESIWPVRSMGGFGEYWPVFLANIGQTWGFMATAAWPLEAPGWVRAASCWAMLGCAGLGGALALRRVSEPGARVAAAAVLAFAVVLPLHLGFASTRLGFSVPAASFRYDLALWPGLLHALMYAAGAVRRPWARKAVLGVGAAALVVGWA